MYSLNTKTTGNFGMQFSCSTNFELFNFCSLHYQLTDINDYVTFN